MVTAVESITKINTEAQPRLHKKE